MGQSRLHGVIQTDKSLATVVVHHATCLQPLRSLEAQAVVSGIGVELKQVFLHAADSPVDRHVVVVEDDEQVVVGRRDVVQALEGKSAAHGTIADDGHHLGCGMLLVAQCLGSHGHTQRCRYAIGGVSARERVVRALVGRREGAYTAQLTVRTELLAATCEHLVAIGLMAHIPHQTIVGRVENVVKGHGQLDYTQRRGQMSGVDGEFLDDLFAQFLAHLRQLSGVELA